MRALALLPLFLVAGLSGAAEIDAKVEAALAAEARPAADRERDRNRRPLATLKFFGLKDDMKVLELLPGGGWYTDILAPVMNGHGAYIAENADMPGFPRAEQRLLAARRRQIDGQRLERERELQLEGGRQVAQTGRGHGVDIPLEVGGLEAEAEIDLVLDPDPPEARIAEVLGSYPFRDVPQAYRNLMELSKERIRFLSTRRCRHFLASIAPELLAAIAVAPSAR